MMEYFTISLRKMGQNTGRFQRLFNAIVAGTNPGEFAVSGNNNKASSKTRISKGQFTFTQVF